MPTHAIFDNHEHATRAVSDMRQPEYETTPSRSSPTTAGRPRRQMPKAM